MIINTRMAQAADPGLQPMACCLKKQKKKRLQKQSSRSRAGRESATASKRVLITRR
jgi:hypothetical protein